MGVLKKEFDPPKMYKGSFYTIIGAGGDIYEWVNGYEEKMKENGIGKPEYWVAFMGQEMNEFFKLSDDKEYPNDLTFLAFPLTGLNIEKLCIFKNGTEDRWFDDICDSNGSHELNQA
jgi:hypothetical protein